MKIRNKNKGYSLRVSEEELITIRDVLHQSISVNISQSIKPFPFSLDMLETIQRELRDDEYVVNEKIVMERFRSLPQEEQRKIIENFIAHIPSESRKDIRTLLDNLEYNENL